MGALDDIRNRITGFAIDHRKVRPGHVFGAFRGARFDGESVIADAIAAGAIAVVARPEAVVAGALHLADPRPRQLFARLAADFHAPFPQFCVAVTGTNGKTSTVDLVRQLWNLAGKSAASMGTLGVITAQGTADGTNGLTTPDILTFLQTAAALAGQDITHLAFEASSHGLSQARCEGLPVQVGAFTNLTRDHLDYHRDMDSYFAAKQRLFAEVVDAEAVAIVWLDASADGAQFNARMADVARERGLRLWTVGPDGADIQLLARTPLEQGQELRINAFGQQMNVHLPLIGGYQAANALQAAAIVIAAGGDTEQTLGNLQQMAGVRGRLEHVVTTTAGAAVYVDYAHTPDALHAAIDALRPHTSGRLIAVFGCGGDRDQGKRPQMGQIASRLADIVYVTDDNPRSEDAAAIRAEVLQGAPAAIEMGDRRMAIAAALADARAGDVVLLAGKGHEQGQIIGDQVLPFDDAAVAREIAGSQP